LEENQIIFISLGLMILFVFFAFGLQSRREHEERVFVIFFTTDIFGSSLFLLAILLPIEVQWMLFISILALILISAVSFFIPIERIETVNDIPKTRFDERDIVFARAGLQLGSPEYRTYYRTHAENKAFDDQFRKLPGLLSPNAKKRILRFLLRHRLFSSSRNR
jgi:membrane-associated phospholipid phosphatase